MHIAFSHCSLALAGSMWPSLLSASYFLIFWFLVIYWAVDSTLKESTWLKIRNIIVCYSSMHSLLLYAYQFAPVQERWKHNQLTAR